MSFDRDLVRSVARPIVLQLVSERPMYGYEIIKVINQRSNNTFQWREGTLYPCLHRLEGEGLVKSEWLVAESGRKRKYYNITRKGKAILAEKEQEWGEFAAAVNSILFGTAGA